MTNDPVTTARVLLCLLAAIPSIVGYYWVQYYDYFPQHSLKQIGLLLLTLFLVFGSLVLQFHVYHIVGHMSKGDMFTRVLIIVQYFFAAVILFTAGALRDKAKRRKGRDMPSGSEHSENGPGSN